MRRTLLVLSGAALVAACGTTATAPIGTPAGAPAPAPAPDPGSPQPTPGLDWLLSLDGDQAKLAYGVPNSDDLRLGMECVRGSGVVRLVRDVPPGAAAEFHLESGGDTQRIAARAEPSEMSGGQFLTADLPAAAPVLARFAQTGWLAQWDDGLRAVHVAQPGSTRRPADFLAFCRGG